MTRARSLPVCPWASCVQVKDARETAREAAGLLQQLQQFVGAHGPGGDWQAWLASHAPYAGELA